MLFFDYSKRRDKMLELLNIFHRDKVGFQQELHLNIEYIVCCYNRLSFSIEYGIVAGTVRRLMTSLIDAKALKILLTIREANDNS